MLYKQGGPATFKGFVVFDDSFEGVAPSTSQTLDPGATITFTLQFLFTHILQCTFNANAQDCIIACQDRGVEAVERCVLLEPSSPERAECFRKFIMENDLCGFACTDQCDRFVGGACVGLCQDKFLEALAVCHSITDNAPREVCRLETYEARIDCFASCGFLR